MLAQLIKSCESGIKRGLFHTADNFRICGSVVPVDFMDKVVESDYRSGPTYLFTFTDSDPVPFILILRLHLLCVVRAAW